MPEDVHRAQDTSASAMAARNSFATTFSSTMAPGPIRHATQGMGRELTEGAAGIVGQPLLQTMASTSMTRALWAAFQAW